MDSLIFMKPFCLPFHIFVNRLFLLFESPGMCSLIAQRQNLSNPPVCCNIFLARSKLLFPLKSQSDWSQCRGIVGNVSQLG